MKTRGYVIVTFLCAVFILTGAWECIVHPHPAVSLPIPWWISGPVLIAAGFVGVIYMLRMRLKDGGSRS